jgi:hypothetical protein
VVNDNNKNVAINSEENAFCKWEVKRNLLADMLKFVGTLTAH